MLTYSTIQHLAALIRSKQISPVELIDAHLARIAALQPKLNAFVHLNTGAARTQARAAEAAVLRGDSSGPLHGIPLTVKSSLDVTGWPSPAGSALRKDYLAQRDAPLVARLRSAGAILLGNTNTPEFLMAYETDNLLAGKTSNPWNLSHTAGGSSGGEAAAIASGCSAGGIGSDGGGSIRVPAHFSGICGLKPTPGRVPATGHFPACTGAFSWIGVVGPMARTVADLRALFEVIAGPDPGDPFSAPVPLRPVTPAQLAGLRVGILESPALGSSTPETQSAINRAAKILSDQSFIVEPFHLRGLDSALDLWWFFFGNTIAHTLAETFAAHEHLLSPMLHEYFAVAAPQTPITLDRFLSACSDRDILRAQILDQMREVPILLSPVSSEPAFLHGQGTMRPGAPHSYRDTMRFSQWLNLAGFPAAAVPLALSSDGLPIGVQIIGRPHEEELVLAVAEKIEQARGPWQPPPLEGL